VHRSDVGEIRMSRMSRRNHRGKLQAGFTMVELLISMVILMVGVMAVAELVPHAVKSNFRNRISSTSLIWSQRMMEQMAAQPIAALPPALGCPPGGQAAPAGYAFCDQDGDGIGLGEISNLDGATSTGCPLAGDRALDFTTPVTACPAGYFVNKDVLWDINTNVTVNVELRWNVITWHLRGNPIRKLFIVGARTGAPGQGFVVRNLHTVIGR